MSVLRKRPTGLWHDPLAYAGLTGARPRRAANDNRSCALRSSRSVKARCWFVGAAFGIAATLGWVSSIVLAGGLTKGW
jgi:hypothetical protein